MQLAEYRADTSDWASKATRLQHMWTWVNATVDPQLLAPAMMTLVEQKKSTLQALIKALRTELAPTSISTINLVRAQYRAHLQKAKQGRVNPESWYAEWHSLYAKAKAYKIADIEGLLAVQDFLDALAPKLSPEWARTMHQSVVQSEVLGITPLTLHEVAKIFSALLQEHKLRASNQSTGIFATLGNPAPEPSASNPKRPCPCGKHKWPATECRKLQTALTGKPLTLTDAVKDQILASLADPSFDRLRQALAKKGWTSNALEKVRKPSYPGTIAAALIDPNLLLDKREASGIYTTMDFDAHPLSASTILDNGAALHLVNTLDLIQPGTFIKASGITCVEAGTQSFPILGKGTRVLKGVINGARGENTEDLLLKDVAVVEGFHVNIISEARLEQVGVWYLGLDATLRIGSLQQSTVLAKLKR
ncbi:hypothetical protein EJ02DRAFT_416381, partial [Clathrospora elynae]